MKLKMKERLFYRKATRADHAAGRTCGDCGRFIAAHPVHKIGGDLKGYEPRCYTMGTGNSIRYRVRADHTCGYFKAREVPA